jgi:septal ring factor EnvC (AmiA/AmiB activator)
MSELNRIKERQKRRTHLNQEILDIDFLLEEITRLKRELTKTYIGDYPLRQALMDENERLRKENSELNMRLLDA